MNIIVSLSSIDKVNNEDCLKQEFDLLCHKLKEEGYYVDDAIRIYYAKKGVVGVIHTTRPDTFGDGELVKNYDKLFEINDSGLVGYGFLSSTGYKYYPLSFRTILEYFEGLIIKEDKELLSSLYILEKAIRHHSI